MDKAISILFMSRTCTHIQHLRTRSYAEHKALNEFYDEIIDLADELAEGYQGRYGIMNNIEVMKEVCLDCDSVEMLQEHLRMFESATKNVDDRFLQNIVDEIVALYVSTLYKLRFLDSGSAMPARMMSKKGLGAL